VPTPAKNPKNLEAIFFREIFGLKARKRFDRYLEESDKKWKQPDTY